MKRPVTSKGIQIIAIVTMLGVAAVLLIQRFGPLPRQLERIAAAREHANRTMPQIQGDPRFSDITLGGNSGYGGHMNVSGYVASLEDSNDLRRIVEASHPPVETRYDGVRIMPRALLETKK